MSVGFRLLSSLPFALAAMLFSMCSEPTPPEVVPPILQPDTTTHEYTWEYHFFGQSPVSTSWFRDIHIVNDDNFWKVGDVQIDTIIYTRSGLSTQRVTAVHWDGKKFTPYALEGLTLSDQVRGVPIYAVEGRAGSVCFMSSGSRTEMRDDCVAIHILRVLAGRWYTHQPMHAQSITGTFRNSVNTTPVNDGTVSRFNISAHYVRIKPIYRYSKQPGAT